MRRIAIALMGTVSGLVLLFSYHTSLGSTTAGGDGAGNGMALTGNNGDATAAAADDQTGQQTQTGQGGQDGQDGNASPPATRTTPKKAAGGGVSGTFTGSTAQTKWGPVQVRIVVANNKITKAVVLQHPTGHRKSEEINSWAVPRLTAETVQANSANIDSVGGATVTSQGYVSSLQSALDKAHL